MKTLFEKYISVNKSLEINAGYERPCPQVVINTDFEIMTRDYYFIVVLDLFNLIYLNLQWDRKNDHAGFHFDLRIPFFGIGLNVTDNRHWDYDNDRWEIYHKDGDRVNYDIFKFLEKDHGKWYFLKTWRVRFEYRGGEYVRIRQKLL